MFTYEELDLLSDSVLALMDNTKKARVLVCHDEKSVDAINEYMEKLQRLNEKICGEMTK